MADYFEEARQTDTTMTVTTAATTPETTALVAPATEGPTIMAYPPGVSLATITIGAGRTMFGAPPKLISATVTPIFVGTPHVVHAASGWPFYPTPRTFRVENGEELTFELPHVNAEGWRDTAGNEFPAVLDSGERDRGWAYHAKFTVIGGSGQDAIPHRYEKVFQPLVGQTEPLDLDLVPDGRIGAPVSAPVAAVLSIAGFTGAVSEDQLRALGLGDDVSVDEPLPGTYTIGSTGVVEGLTSDKKLPPAALGALASDIGLETSVIGSALGSRFALKSEAGAKDADVAALVMSGAATSEAVFKAVDKRGAVVNALAHGYDPSGATTSHVAVQAAMDSLATFGGGTVFVPDGELKISVSLKPRDNVRVVCNEGMVHVTATTSTYAFLVDQPIHQALPTGFTVEGFVFEGSKRVPPQTPARDQFALDNPDPGLKSGGWFMGEEGEKPDMPYIGDITYRNCVFKNMHQPIHYAGISGHGVVTGCKFFNTLDPSFTYMQNAKSLRYTHNLTVDGSDNGVSVSRLCKNAVISDNIMINCAFYGVWVSGFVGSSEIPGYGPDRFVVADNVIYNCGEGGISALDAPRYGTISGNLVDTILRGPLDQPTFSRGYGMRISGFPSNGTMTRAVDTLNITGNTFRNIPRAGISIAGSRNVRIGENLFVNIGEEFVMNADGTVSTTPISSTETQYNCGIMSPNSSSLINVVITNNTFIDDRATPLMNYAIAPNVEAVVTRGRNIVLGSRNPHNEPVEAGNNRATDASFIANGAAGSAKSVFFHTAGSRRWQIRASSSPEGGANAGTNLEVLRFGDNGSYISTPLAIDRATGEIRFNDQAPVFVKGIRLGNGGIIHMGSSSGSGATLGESFSKIGFFGATPVAKPSLTYSKATETAPEAQLRAALVALGLVKDDTTA